VTREPKSIKKNWLLSHKRNAHLENLVGSLLIIGALALVVWTIWLRNYSFTWTSIDSFEVLGLLSCGLLFRQANPSARTAAFLTIPIFFLDAWFDIFTSPTKSSLRAAIAMALFGELPAIIILMWVAWKARSFKVKR
jgi:hypothetical protein